MTAREHARLLGLFFWIYVGFQMLMYILSGVFVFVWMGMMMPNMMRTQGGSSPSSPDQFFGMLIGIMIAVLLITVVFLIPELVAGYGLRNDRSWAKIWAIIASCIALLNIPVGTALGVYGLWFIFGEQGKEYFGEGSGRAFTPPPPPQNWQ